MQRGRAGRRQAVHQSCAAASNPASGTTRVTSPAARASVALRMPPRRHEVERQLLPGEPPEEDHDHRGDEAPLDLGIAQLGRLGRNHDVAGRRQPRRPPRAPGPSPAPRPGAGRSGAARAACPAAARHARSRPARDRPTPAVHPGPPRRRNPCPHPGSRPPAPPGSRSTPSSAECSASTMAPLSALRLSGRLSVSVRTASRRSDSRTSLTWRPRRLGATAVPHVAQISSSPVRASRSPSGT